MMDSRVAWGPRNFSREFWFVIMSLFWIVSSRSALLLILSITCLIFTCLPFIWPCNPSPISSLHLTLWSFSYLFSPIDLMTLLLTRISYMIYPPVGWACRLCFPSELHIRHWQVIITIVFFLLLNWYHKTNESIVELFTNFF
jgi:hypothetical protein